MSWVDRHGWLPFLRGTDGLTGRQRHRMARKYARTIGRRDEQMTEALRQAIRHAVDNRSGVTWIRPRVEEPEEVQR